MTTNITCYSCGAKLEDEEDLRLHMREQRTVEYKLGWDAPRARVVLAMSGNDHDLVSVEVTRRAIGGIVRPQLPV